MEVDQIDRARRAWEILIDLAAKREKITYGQLSNRMTLSHHRPTRFFLDLIQSHCKDNNLPPLSILAVGKNGKPGKGFTESPTGNFEQDQELVFSYDWKDLPNPFISGVQLQKLTARNPNWSRDELILALNLYMSVDGHLLDDSDSRVIELSQILNNLSQYSGTKETFRNPNGVAMKLGNFSRFDPRHISDGKKGLQRGSKLDEEIWNEFSDDVERLKKVSASIYSAISVEDKIFLYEDEPEISEAIEGRILTRVHRSRERNTKIVKKKKDITLKKLEALRCEACGFDFYRVYGDRGRGFIECHHIKPLSSYKDEEETKLDDLALVCANCHRMIHASRPWLSIRELIELLKNKH